jgi:opacity protein-like surface antigen
MKKSLLACALVAGMGQTAAAEEVLWLYAKGTDTRPEGTHEIKLTDTIRIDKNSGDYTFHDIRASYEYGITDKLTVEVVGMYFIHDYEVDDPELNPMYETQEANGGSFSDGRFAGTEFGLKYNVLSPYKDVVGLSFSTSYENREVYRLDGASIDQDSYVFRGLVQKNFLEDTLITVLNVKTEFERRKTPGVLEEEFAIDWSLAASYRVAPKWFVGLEFRSQSDYLNPQEYEEAGQPGYDDQGFNLALDRSNFDVSDFRIGSRHQYGNYFGPSVHYTEESWWLTVAALWQVKGGGSEFAYVSDNKNWDEHEKLHLGAIWGYEF